MAEVILVVFAAMIFRECTYDQLLAVIFLY